MTVPGHARCGEAAHVQLIISHALSVSLLGWWLRIVNSFLIMLHLFEYQNKTNTASLNIVNNVLVIFS